CCCWPCWPIGADILVLCTSERIEREHSGQYAGFLAAGRRRSADEVEYPAILHAIVGKPLDPLMLVEIDRDDALVGHHLWHESDQPLGALGNIVVCLAAHRRDRGWRSEDEQDLLLA